MGPQHRRPASASRSARRAAIYDHFWSALTPEERNDPRWDPKNNIAWSTFFSRQREDMIAAYNDNGPLQENFNSEGRRRWWSAPGKNLA
jgi:hypothetical protein